VDQELKQYLDAKFAHVDAELAHVDAKVAQMDAKFAQIDERFAEVDRRAEAMEASLRALIEKTETNLLGAFYNWARPMEARVQSVSTMVSGFDLRLGLAEQRISELERKRAS